MRDEMPVRCTLLETLAGLVRPVMKQVDRKIRAARTEGPDGRVLSDALAGNGLVLVDSFTEEPHDDREETGDYGGSRLVLMRSGKFVEQRRTGHWGPSGGSWKAETEDLDVAEAARRWRLDKPAVVGAVYSAISAALNRQEAAASTLRERLDEVDATFPDEVKKLKDSADAETDDRDSDD